MPGNDELRPVEGRVKWFDRSKGFGFIVDDDGGQDILLHVNTLRSFGQSSVCDGTSIRVLAQQTQRGWQAVEVLELALPSLEDMTEADGSPLPPGLEDIPGEPARVKWFDKAKGFGFCNVFGESADVFIHMEVLRRSGYSDLQPGEAIVVKVVDGERGRMAALVLPWEQGLQDEDHDRTSDR
ncbi:cold shock domain-containing protein [Rhodobacteraceae bacterium 2376]|uniref:Cold shock domain-containing protein n=1 Tax=Rhabdonatronobacter sediminivivens TaxID=2743469 RepID=A0A7Z0HWG1_9RHOB|nr:cold shock domain-containing protein [Rhabdonatronobacter sediminivivens]NYS23610.1 cold shock domain-containing protein [Rhabdonatronobacter sediminivivens]